MLNVIYNNKHLNNLDKSRPVVLALSGGVDSMVLFDMLLKANFNVIIAHVNHHKRAESAVEEQYIRQLSKDKNCIIEVMDYIHEKDNFQAEAHNHRYEFFKSICNKYNASCLITAHHYIDNFETIIMNIIRGSNIYGYSGIKEYIYTDDITIIRPLINVDKADLYEYAKLNNITFFEDSSNQSDDYLRNRIRHHVIPLLQKENPSLKTSVANYSNQLQEAFNYIRGNSVKYLENNNNKIDINSFNFLALIEKKDIINYICDKRGILSSDNKITDILNIIENPKPNLTYDLNDKWQFVKSYNICYVEEKKNDDSFSYTIDKNHSIEIENFGSFILSTKEELSDQSLKVSLNEKLPLTIRKRENGDRLIIGEGHKKLKDFLIDKKVPLKERDNLIIVTNAVGEIIWVVGYYKKRCNEKNSLILTFKEKIYDRKI